MQRLKSVLSRFSAEEWLLMAALVAAGGFYDAVSCALAVPTAVLLIVRVVRNRRLLLRVNIGTVAVALIALGSLMTCLFAKDRGEALVGFLRFLPVALLPTPIISGLPLRAHTSWSGWLFSRMAMA